MPSDVGTLWGDVGGRGKRRRRREGRGVKGREGGVKGREEEREERRKGGRELGCDYLDWKGKSTFLDSWRFVGGRKSAHQVLR